MRVKLFFTTAAIFFSGVNVDGQSNNAETLTSTMFEAIGGIEKWARVRSLYIKAIHTEPTLQSPYQSEIWRSVDEFKLRIEQHNDDFHNLGLFSERGGWVRYLKKDSTRKLSDEALKSSQKNHDLNIYVLLKKIASYESYKPVLNGQRLEFYKAGTFIVAFILDEKFRPSIFITKNENGIENASHFDKWHESDGFIHPAGGGPIDGNFHYRAEIWQPSNQSFEEAFDVNYLLDEK